MGACSAVQADTKESNNKVLFQLPVQAERPLGIKISQPLGQLSGGGAQDDN
jgi:hypothetical protein